MGYYSALKKKKGLLYATARAKLKDSTQSEISHRKTNAIRSTYMEVSKLVKFTEAENRIVVSRYGKRKK